MADFGPANSQLRARHEASLVRLIFAPKVCLEYYKLDRFKIRNSITGLVWGWIIFLRPGAKIDLNTLVYTVLAFVVNLVSNGQQYQCAGLANSVKYMTQREDVWDLTEKFLSALGNIEDVVYCVLYLMCILVTTLACSPIWVFFWVYVSCKTRPPRRIAR